MSEAGLYELVEDREYLSDYGDRLEQKLASTSDPQEKSYFEAKKKFEEYVLKGQESLENSGGFFRGIYNWMTGEMTVEDRVNYLLNDNPDEGLVKKMSSAAGKITKGLKTPVDPFFFLNTKEAMELRAIYHGLESDDLKKRFKQALAGYITHAQSDSFWERLGSGVLEASKKTVGVAAGALLAGVFFPAVGAAIGLGTLIPYGAIPGIAGGLGVAAGVGAGLDALGRLPAYRSDSAVASVYDQAMSAGHAWAAIQTAGMSNLFFSRTGDAYALYTMHKGADEFMSAWKVHGMKLLDENFDPTPEGVHDIMEEREKRDRARREKHDLPQAA